MRKRPRRSQRPTLEFYEARPLMSGVMPVDLLSVGDGVVAQPGAIARIGAIIEGRNLARGRASTLIGLDARPAPGETIQPRILLAEGPGGRRLPIRVGAPFIPRINERSLAYARDGRAGTLTSGVTGSRGTTGGVVVSTFLPGDVNGDGLVDLADLRAFAPAYNTRRGDPAYLPSADANRNGQVGQGDARFILRNLTPLTPRIPLRVDVHLAAEDLLHDATVTSDPDGITRHRVVTVVGRTTPGSIVFLDGPDESDFNFEEMAIPTDATGAFSYSLQLNDKLTNTQYLVIDPYGQQTIRALPIRLVE